MQDLEKMLWLMVQWEVAQSHLHIISNLRSVSGLRFSLLHNLAVNFEIILISCLFCVVFHQIVFFGIDNIHAMRDSFARLRDYLDTHGATSSDGMSSFLVSLDIRFTTFSISNHDIQFAIVYECFLSVIV